MDSTADSPPRDHTLTGPGVDQITADIADDDQIAAKWITPREFSPRAAALGGHPHPFLSTDRATRYRQIWLLTDSQVTLRSPAAAGRRARARRTVEG